MGLVPAASYGNRKAIVDLQLDPHLDPVWMDILFDPQTSGGLLFALPRDQGVALVAALEEANTPAASLIGSVEAFSGLSLRVTG